jgi:hypothetical protein
LFEERAPPGFRRREDGDLAGPVLGGVLWTTPVHAPVEPLGKDLGDRLDSPASGGDTPTHDADFAGIFSDIACPNGTPLAGLGWTRRRGSSWP